jgi:hypothetical protein
MHPLCALLQRTLTIQTFFDSTISPKPYRQYFSNDYNRGYFTLLYSLSFSPSDFILILPSLFHSLINKLISSSSVDLPAVGEIRTSRFSEMLQEFSLLHNDFPHLRVLKVLLSTDEKSSKNVYRCWSLTNLS